MRLENWSEFQLLPSASLTTPWSLIRSGIDAVRDIELSQDVLKRVHDATMESVSPCALYTKEHAPPGILKCKRMKTRNVVSTMNQEPRLTTFSDWTSNRELISLGTNAGAQTLPFQSWRRIKESFAPELIARAIEQSPIQVRRCIDPFAGSGTTGIACQFLGVHPVLVEVNPYLADLTEAKLSRYPSTERLRRDLDAIVEWSNPNSAYLIEEYFENAPRTFVQPGHKGRWLFNRNVAERIVAIRNAISCLDDPSERLFRVVLGGILVEVSNVRVSGKGRRYRRRWNDRVIPPGRVDELFLALASQAIDEIGKFQRRLTTSYDIHRGDSRIALQDVDGCDLAVFSPPYPNSFDYTDVYNVELWGLGYLNNPAANSSLRLSTLSSHVQISRDFPKPPSESPTLSDVLKRLEKKRQQLWDPMIPSMVGAYFYELQEVLNQIGRILNRGGSAWIVVGDSRYAGVQIPVGNVLKELAEGSGWDVLLKEPFRSMRSSAQQGGEKMLTEHLLVVRRAA